MTCPDCGREFTRDHDSQVHCHDCLGTEVPELLGYSGEWAASFCLPKWGQPAGQYLAMGRAHDFVPPPSEN